MKRWIAVFTAAVMLLLGCGVSAGAVSLEAGKDALIKEFVYGEGPETDGYTLDYRFYSPVTHSGDTTEYPVVIWLHGHSHGQYDGYQIKSNDITNWASEEFQSRFAGTRGAFVVAVRAPENIGISWSEDIIRPLKATIDSFLAENRKNVNPGRIYMGGFSLGGMMTFQMAMAYPEMFAAIFPVCPYITLTENQAQSFAGIPVWMTSGKKDHLVSYSGRIMKNWEAITNTSLVAESCRLSSLSEVCRPDGTAAPSEHYSWEAVTNDMFSANGGAYPYMTTISGTGESISLEYPEGMISWISGFSSDYTTDDTTDTEDSGGKIGILARIKGVFMSIYIIIRNLLRPLFG